jgi:hypothetical protein
MTDYSELKCLAEGANQENAGFMTMARFATATSPTAVLALLADLDEARNGMKHQAALWLKKEIERLVPFEEAYATACSVRNRLIKENELLDRLIVANKIISDSFRDERDQLRAEFEALRKERDKLADEYRSLLEDPGSAL